MSASQVPKWSTSIPAQGVRLISVDRNESPVVEISGATEVATIIISDELGSTLKEAKQSHVSKPPIYEEKKASLWEKILQSWEGRVIYNSPEKHEFTAIISDRTVRANPDEEVVIDYDKVLASDRELISEGAVFFWNFGRYRTFSKKTGKIEPSHKKFEIRFRRLPSMSARQAEDILEISKRIASKIHGY